MELKQNVIVGFVGQWAEIPDWQNKAKRSVVQELNKVPRIKSLDDEILTMAFVSSVPPSRNKLFPSGIPGEAHARRCQELLLARQSDIVVLINTGIAWDSESMQEHMNVLEQVSKVLVIWTPQEIAEEQPTEEDMALRPGVMPVHGGLATLSKLLIYLATSEMLGVVRWNASELRNEHIFPVRELTREEREAEESGEGIEIPVKQNPLEEDIPDAFEVEAATSE